MATNSGPTWVSICRKLPGPSVIPFAIMGSMKLASIPPTHIMALVVMRDFRALASIVVTVVSVEVRVNSRFHPDNATRHRKRVERFLTAKTVAVTWDGRLIFHL